MLQSLGNEMSKKIEIQFYLNNQLICISDPDPTQTLLEFLRVERKLTGTKEGCAEGDCGACTVLIGKLNNKKEIVYKTANSCILFIPSVAFCHIVSVEGLARRSSELHPVQKAMVDTSAAQCGFCTPGFVMSLYGLWLKRSKLSKQQVLNSLQGNLCRCTGYGPIIEAGLKISKKGLISNDELVLHKSKWEKRLAQLMNNKKQVKPDDQSCFFIPRTIPQLKKVLSNNKNGTIVAGSTDVGLWVNKAFKDISPAIFIGQIDELKQIRIKKDIMVLGSMVSYSDLEEVFSKYFPTLCQYTNQIGGDQIRNMGTIGGNIANGSPIGDMAPIFIALGAKMTLASQAGSRKIEVESFFQDYGHQDIKPDEFIVNFEIPLLKKANCHLRAYKVAKRRYEDITTVSAAFYLDNASENNLKVRFVFGGMAGIPKRAPTLEKSFSEKSYSFDQDSTISESIANDFSPLTDCRGSSNYRLKLAKNLFRKFSLFINEKLEIDIEKDL